VADWPRPREDPDEEPAEPWAKPGPRRPWEELLREAEQHAADEKTDPLTELQQ